MGKKFILTIIVIIIFLVIVFNLVGNISTNLTGGAESITDANNCSDGKDNTGAALTYNITDKYCYNSSADWGKDYLAKQYDLPLNSLFASGGILMLILMFMIFIFIIGFLIAIRKEGIGK